MTNPICPYCRSRRDVVWKEKNGFGNAMLARNAFPETPGVRVVVASLKWSKA